MRLFLLMLILAGFVVCEVELIDEPFFKSITYLNYMELMNKVRQSEHFEKIFKVSDGYKQYNINERPICDGKFCVNPIFEVSSFYKGEDFVKTLPTVMVVGTIHGNEVVGAYTLYHLIEYINSYFNEKEYLRILLENVRFLFLPIANPNGFYELTREEKMNDNISIDINRDFPYDAEIGCLKSPTSRLIDTIFKNNLIIGCLTYHGGANSISYPWGNFPHESNPKSNDHMSFGLVAEALSQAAGENKNFDIPKYDVGLLQDIVYNVRGGFEDYAYSASFDKENISKMCKHQSLLSQEVVMETNYDDFSHRAFVYLVESSKEKIPKESTLGRKMLTNLDRFDIAEWGHVNRNINLILRFAQIISNFAVVESIRFESGFVFEISIYGCLTLDEIKPDYGFEVVSKKYDNRLTKWSIIMKINSDLEVIPKLTINVECDKKFFEDKQPESHFVRLKTGVLDEIAYKQNKITKMDKITITVKNIMKSLLSKAVIVWERNNEHHIVYNNVMLVNDDVILKYENGSVQTIIKNGKKILISESTTFEHSHFNKDQLVLYHGTFVPMKAQTFLNLPGKLGYIYLDTIKSSDFLIKTGFVQPENEKYGALLIDKHQLLGQVLTFDPPMFVLVSASTDLFLKITLVSRFSKILSINFVEGELLGEFIEKVEVKANDVFVITRKYRVANADQLKLIGRTLELVDSLSRKSKVVLGIMHLSKTLESIIQENYNGWRKDMNRVIPLVIFGLLFILLALALIKMSHSKNILREPLQTGEMTVRN